MDSIPIILLCFIPLLFLAAFVGHEGKKYIIYVLWGFIASILSFGLYWGITGTLPDPSHPTLFVSPVIEEFLKALPIMILAVIGIRNSNRDLLVCAMAIGIGFSVIETVLYSITQNLTFIPGDIMVVLARSFSTSLMHGCTTAIIGYGVVLIRNVDRGALPALLFGFYTLAVTTHAIYNLLWDSYSGAGGAVVDLIFPMALFFLLLICYRVDVPVIFRARE